MKNKINTASWTLRIAAVLTCLVILTANLLSGIMARYTVGDNGGDGGRVAGFAFSVNNSGKTTFDFDLSEVNYPGAYKDFTFTVSNKQGSTVSEVSELVTANIKTDGGIPLVITLAVNSDTHTFTVDEPQELFSAEIAAFPGAVEQEQSFTLRVEWPGSASDIALMNEPMEVILSMTAEQID